MTAAAYPTLAKVIASGTFERVDDDDDFEYGLQCVLDGIAARIERHLASAAPPDPARTQEP